MDAIDLHHTPLHDDAALEEGLAALLAPVARRQVWMLFLDQDDVLTGPLMPSDDLPADPRRRWRAAAGQWRPACDLVAETFSAVLDDLGLARLVIVWERPGTARLDTEVREWARALHERFRALGTPVRAQLLLSSHGMRVITPDDLV